MGPLPSRCLAMAHSSAMCVTFLPLRLEVPYPQLIGSDATCAYWFFNLVNFGSPPTTLLKCEAVPTE